ncbi:hypothetical protein INT47_006603 [Mucor saturninus]|uniref:Transposase n=1 Tax=Mucor saturninus TaxID=64648 RepID=A0A8H7QMR8_9FUNG|nr:hypothetical protein INT47_006603 [Mucor saturninus]
MTFGFSFYYSNRYNLQFVGLKKSINKDMQKTPIINQEQPCLVIDNSQIEKEIKQPNDAIKIQKKEYAALGKSIQVEEWNRMNLGRSFRAKEKSNHPWDTKLYKQLKEKRSDCDNIYSQLRKLNSSLKDLRYRMFALNKARHRQSLPISTNSLQIPDKMKADLKNNRLLIQGVDPGIVTTAAISCVKSSTLFESLNRFQMLENHEPCTIPISNQKGYEYDYTANKINQAVLSNTHRLQREKKKKYDIEKNRLTRKIRLNTYHKKHYSATKRDIFSYHGWKQGSILFFVGNWSGKGAYIRGHTRRSMKPILNRFNSVANDHIAVVDEFKSTITCSSCFEVTTKQVVRVGEKRVKRIKGAVTCTNHNCPRRLSPTRRTTVNRDMNGTINIALIGFSCVVSNNSLPLPPFRRGIYNANKFNLSHHYQCASLATLESPVVPET